MGGSVLGKVEWSDWWGLDPAVMVVTRGGLSLSRPIGAAATILQLQTSPSLW